MLFSSLALLILTVCAVYADDKTQAEVCGSDDYTYGNELRLNEMAVRNRGNIKKAYDGRCSCEEYNKNKKVQECGKEVDEICGSDLVTYVNFCHMCKEESRKQLSQLIPGPCPFKWLEYAKKLKN